MISLAALACGGGTPSGAAANATCTPQAACTPANPCHAGAEQCTSAGSTCQDLGTSLPDGTQCQPNWKCSGGTCIYTWGGTVTVTSAPPLVSEACVGAPVVVTITAAGPVPGDVSVPGGGCVTFVNDDAVPHLIDSDPHPLHTDCPT